MWLNKEKTSELKIKNYRHSLLASCPNHIVIDDLFNTKKLDKVVSILQQADNWKTQKHTYDSLYVNNSQWDKTCSEERFVKRDAWQYPQHENDHQASHNPAQDFLCFLRSEEFMAFLSRIFNVQLTDLNVANPTINTNFFRLGGDDFVEIHADDSPGREVCMLIYLNKDWSIDAGGELVFSGKHKPISITPFYNRCVLFDPSSEGAEHWVRRLNAPNLVSYRYNITSWYWSE